MDEFPHQLEESKEQFIEKIADNMRTFGVSETIGRVLGIIYMNREPMTLDQLSEATGMSKVRMSQVVRQMIELNIAEKVFKKGVRKDLIKVEDDYYQTFISLFTSNWRKAISKSRAFERKLRNELNAMEAEEWQDESAIQEKQELIEEIKLWTDYYDWISRLVEFFESGEIFNHVPKKEGGNQHGK
ncbi:GbsR/MarR family transcriptional regulator [Virgibacillus sp. 179-BFC.A HS]|uniref:HTH-type transcriptional regulator n=1 Tax=Tigheibacillus jepli TaxID=3035914 RepID=A0ABU5CJ35_9BACI|nr:GbsR/MarR family transcriptional regulator [Virgibacillus sp. 179-BFC.A HS]MDY0406320.1 GbsR/MarR family transcriptional regulator [Virgibacillus sp. 179-BFC.A HS]